MNQNSKDLLSRTLEDVFAAASAIQNLLDVDPEELSEDEVFDIADSLSEASKNFEAFMVNSLE